MVARVKLLKLRCISVVLGVLFFPLCDAQALLTGTNVTGSLVTVGAQNLFDPANSSVPGGCGNSAPGDHIDVAIGAGTEFCVVTGASVIGDFTDTTLNLQFSSPITTAYNPQTYSFTDAAFSGLTLTEQSDNWSGGMSCSLATTTLTCVWAGGNLTGPFTFDAVYSFTQASSVPEPSSLALLLFGVAALVARGRKHRKTSQPH